MSEYQNYYTNFAEAGVWKNPDKDLCGCRGSGWFLSEVDTWHHCHLHNTGQIHPEMDYGDYEDEKRDCDCLSAEQDRDYQKWEDFGQIWVAIAVHNDPLPF